MHCWQVTLSGTPLSPGTLLLLGCRLQWTYAFPEAAQKLGEAAPQPFVVTWVQPWNPLPLRKPQGGTGGIPQGAQDSPMPSLPQVNLLETKPAKAFWLCVQTKRESHVTADQAAC